MKSQTVSLALLGTSTLVFRPAIGGVPLGAELLAAALSPTALGVREIRARGRRVVVVAGSASRGATSRIRVRVSPYVVNWVQPSQTC